MNKLVIVLCLVTTTGFAQKVKLSGFIRDALSGEALVYASCFNMESSVGATSNAMGYYDISINKGAKVLLTFSYIGYHDSTLCLQLYRDTMISINLNPKTQLLSECTVNDFASVQKNDVAGKITVPSSTIQSIPSFVGVPDLMKAITFIPGVSGGREGYSNLYVRGGDRGQNLILLDGMKLYNTNHLGGFLSVLDADILKHVDVYKGGFPARYGGRASSIVDAYSKDGNKNQLKGKFNIGILNSGVLLEGPLSDQVSFLFAGRTSYYNLIEFLDQPDVPWEETFKYSVYDIYAKITWRPKVNHALSLSFFNAGDIQKYHLKENYSSGLYEESNGMDVRTHAASVLYRGKLNSSSYNESMLVWSRYHSNMYTHTKEGLPDEVLSNRVSSFSDIEDLSFKSKFSHILTSVYTIYEGVEISYYRFVPGLQTSYYENELTESNKAETIGFTDDLKSLEGAMFIENQIDLSRKLRLNLGARGVAYFCSDTSYFRFEPRISMRYFATNRLSLKASYTLMNQYNHVLVNNVNGFEREIWFSATKELLPQNAQQGSVGLFFDDNEHGLQFSVEAFYKIIGNLLEYQSPVLEEDHLGRITDIVARNGVGKAKGLELYAKKDFTKLNVNLNYTLSWSHRKFDELNNGDWYPFIFDRRHDISFVCLYQINKTYSMGTNFVFTSGAAITLPQGFSKGDGLVSDYYIYDGLNNQRLPPYHRMDVNINRKKITKRGLLTTWSLNIFNVYARNNPVYIYYDASTGKVKQKNIFTITPTINYSLAF